MRIVVARAPAHTPYRQWVCIWLSQLPPRANNIPSLSVITPPSSPSRGAGLRRLITRQRRSGARFGANDVPAHARPAARAVPQPHRRRRIHLRRADLRAADRRARTQQRDPRLRLPPLPDPRAAHHVGRDALLAHAEPRGLPVRRACARGLRTR